MSCYVSSNDNRLYVGLESSYGGVASITSQNRIPAVGLTAKQQPEAVRRRDKSGSRTFAGLPSGVRNTTSYQLNTYLTSWADPAKEPSYGPMFQAAMGGAPLFFNGGTVASGSGTQLAFSAAHGLTAGQAVKLNGELRFAAAIIDAQTVQLNAPFTNTPQAGEQAGAAVTYKLAMALKSASLFDYWGSGTAVQRIVAGAAVNKLLIKINADFHEFEFQGPAQDILDNTSFASGLGGLAEFPAEPALAGFDYTIIPGHLGQAWLGVSPHQFFTLTGAEVTLDNGLDARNREFGSDQARCIVGGQRNVSVKLSLFEQDDDATKELYQAARQRSPIGVMFQLGQQDGQLFGLHMNSVTPVLPDFDDSETRLQWQFASSRAQGTVDDEITIAFG